MLSGTTKEVVSLVKFKFIDKCVNFAVSDTGGAGAGAVHPLLRIISCPFHAPSTHCFPLHPQIPGSTPALIVYYALAKA
jgi:hypothetical protein